MTTGSTVYVAGAGPVGLAAAYSAQLLGAAVVTVGDMNAERLRQAESFGCETVDLSSGNELPDMMAVARAGAALGIPGLYVTGDPGGIDENAQVGQIGVKLGLGWAKSPSFTTGHTSVGR